MLFVWFLVSALGQVTVAAAPDDATAEVTIERVQIGFDGNYKVGQWSPIVVHLSTNRSMTLQLVVEAFDPDGSRTALPHPAVELLKAGSHQLEGQFKVGRLDSPLGVRIVEGSTTLAERQFRTESTGASDFRPALKMSSTLVATIGKPAGFSNNATKGEPQSESSTSAGGSESGGLRVAELESYRQLPKNPIAFNGLDALVIAGDFDLSAKHNQAVREWVRSGGHVVLAVGSRVPDYLGSSLANWISAPGDNETPAPVPILGTSQLRDLNGLESLVPRTENSTSIVRRGSRVDAAHIGPTEGEIFVRGLDGPLLVGVPFGFGKITFLGVDLDRAPLSTWNQVSDLATRLVTGERAATSTTEESGRRQLAQTGISDLSTQLYTSQQQFPSLKRYSRSSVMGMMVLYLILVGPIDYFIVHRLLKKPRLTWFTFPSMVIVAAVLACWTAAASNGSTLQLNQLDIVDIDVQSQSVRSNSWMTVYSPETRRYRMDVQSTDLGSPHTTELTAEPSEDASLRLSWSGIPESSFGGMYRTGGFEIGRPPYAFSANGTAIENFPILIWSARTIASSDVRNVQGLVESELESTRPGHLSGTIEHNLAMPIENWMIAFQNTVYRPTSQSDNVAQTALPPGRPFRLSLTTPGIRQRVLNAFLTGTLKRRVEVKISDQGSGIYIERTPYDPLNRNLADIVRMLTFHQEAGGKAYTGLDNDGLRELDLSGQLSRNRAVLFGQIRLPASQLMLDGEPKEATQHWGFVRILLPVAQKHVTPKQLPDGKG